MPLSVSPASFFRSENGAGSAAAFSAFFIWGALPLYWALLAGIPAMEVLAHRIVWSLLAILPFIWLTGRWPEVRAALRTPSVLARVGLGTLCIGVNWSLYIWGVINGHVLEASLGYFINPLLNVLLGGLLLRERLTRIQIMAVLLAGCGVLWRVLAHGQFPWLALGLGITFALYGFSRKTVPMESAPGLCLEALLLFPAAAGRLLWLHSQGLDHFSAASAGAQALLAGTGVVTAVPLLLFAYAARRLPLATLGLLQYVTPTSMFLLGVFIFREPVTASSLATFCCIWSGLALYSWSGLRRMRGLAG